MPLRILVVDDEPSARQTVEAILEGQGYELEFAKNGPQALEKARAHPPAVILLDVMMPGMNGLEVCAAIRADDALNGVPILFLTALDDQQTFMAALKTGADEFITKPYDPDELRARLIGLTWSNRHL